MRSKIWKHLQKLSAIGADESVRQETQAQTVPANKPQKEKAKPAYADCDIKPGDYVLYEGQKRQVLVVNRFLGEVGFLEHEKGRARQRARISEVVVLKG